MQGWLPGMMWVDVRSEDSHNCWSLILFSMSPRVQHHCSWSSLAPTFLREMLVTT